MSDDESPIGDALLYEAWCVIANVSEGDWSEQPIVWQDAAIRWRDEWHARLSAPATVCVRLDGLADKIAEIVQDEVYALDSITSIHKAWTAGRRSAVAIESLLQSLAVQ
jgi:hypothetical protein